MHSPEPRFSPIAAVIADPTRARIRPLAGTLAKALLEHYVAQQWLTKQTDSRALTVTPKGQKMLLPLLDASQ